MLKERIDDLVDILADEFSQIENTLLIRNNQQLVKYLENPAKWKSEQLAHRQQFKRELARIGAGQLKSLNEKYAKVLLLSYQEIDKDTIKISEKDIEVNKFQNEIKKRIAEQNKENAKSIANLINETFKTYERTVRLLSYTYKSDELFEGIKKQMPKGIQNGIKIAYKDGRQMSFKSYAEMKARTTLQTETSEKQIQAGANAGIIFYVCDSFADCAPDHRDFQGKIYYNAEAKLTEEAEKYIRQNNILSMQQVRDGKPYLTTRPNCRHNFHAISTDDVLGGKSAMSIVEDNGFKFGNYKETNYAKLQEQRYNERQIRKWKTRLENQQQVDKTTGLKNPRAIATAKSKVNEYQARQRQLIKDNPEVLKRNYERENAKIIVEDLGVRYHYKVVDGELVKKK